MAHALQLGARTACPLQQSIPRRFGEASNPGWDREPAGNVKAVWGRDGASGDRPAPTVGTLNLWKCHPASEVLARPNLSCQRPLFCPFAALDQQPEVSKTEPLTNRSVDLGVAVILQSSDQTVLLTRRTCTLRISPNLWVPPGEHLRTGSMGDRCPFPPQCYWAVPYSGDPTSVSITNFLCPLENGVPGGRQQPFTLGPLLLQVGTWNLMRRYRPADPTKKPEWSHLGCGLREGGTKKRTW